MTYIETKRNGWIRAAGLLVFAVIALSPLPQQSEVFADNGGRPVIKVPRASGRQLFQSCVLCHKYDGRGGPSEGGYGADLRVTTLTRAQVIHVITYGRQAKGMPPFKDLLEESKIETLADFILEDLRLKE
jgi:mono/diheme cytochrome c family protein